MQMKRPEQAIHAAILRYLRLQYPRALVHHSPNELNMGGDPVAKAIAQNKAKALGMVPGFPDLFMMHNGVAWFFEVKAPGGRLSDNQRAIGAVIEVNGGHWHVVRSVDDVIEAMRGTK